MTTVSYADAMAQALGDAIERDERVIVLGNHFGGIGPYQRRFDEVEARYPDRVLSPPWSEMGLIGTAVGASCTGLRPIVDIATASFVFQGFAQVVNEAANIACTSGGRTRAPLVLHMLAGLRSAGAAQHSHTPQAMLWNTPGLQIVLPARPADAYGLLMTALLHSEDPTVFVTHPNLFGLEEDVDFDQAIVPFGRARIARPGAEVTVVASSIMVERALSAADVLSERHEIEAEVIDLRTLAPLDEACVLDSVTRTGRLVVADECHRSAGVAGELIARVVESSFEVLVAPPQRVTTADVPIPFSPTLEEAITASAEDIVASVLRTTGPRSRRDDGPR